MERKTSIWPATGAVTPRTHSGRAERRVLTRFDGSLATNDAELIQCYSPMKMIPLVPGDSLCLLVTMYSVGVHIESILCRS